MGQSAAKHYPKVCADLPAQTGKIICITGTTSGTGYVLALTAALKGAEVVMLNRESPRSTAAVEKINAACPTAKVHTVACDLQDFASVRAAAAEVIQKFPDGIDVLVNNAGIMAFPDTATDDGYDCQMQTNHLSHFLLTSLLFPLLERKAQVVGETRVVNHSSMAAWYPSTRLSKRYLGKNGGDLGGDSGRFTLPFTGPEWERYHQTKLANMVFSLALADKLKAAGSKVKCLVAHPGYATTNLQSTSTSMGAMITSFGAMAMAQTAEDGTLGILVCSLQSDMANGEYYGPKGMTGPAVKLSPLALCTDKADHAMLWEASCEAVGDFTVTTSNL